MPASARKTFISPQEYLAIERAGEFKSEYYDGQMYAMSGASLPHNRIVSNLAGELHGQLKGGPCEVLATDMRVALGQSTFVYPDLVIVCDEPQLLDDEFDTLLNPRVIIEVLSPSTEKWDRGGKFAQYQQIPSLRHYILIGQDAPVVERHDLQADDRWLATDVPWPDGVLALDSVGVVISLRNIYFRVFSTTHPT